ncbi:Lrp/AsnC ligand binding domain-containing protein [Streptomyces sp. NPDC000994]
MPRRSGRKCCRSWRDAPAHGVDIEVSANNLQTIKALEDTLSSYEEVVELRRMFGQPDYFLRVAVTDQAAYEAFLIGKLTGLPGVLRVQSHLTIKKIKADT